MSTIRCPLQEAAQISRHRPAVITPEGLLRFGHLEQCVGATAGILQTIGIRPGDRIVLALRPSWRFPIVVMAALRRAAVICPVDPDLPDSLLVRSIRLAESTLIISEGRWVSRFSRMVDIAAADVQRLTGVVYPGGEIHRPAMLSLEQPATMYFVSRADGHRGIIHTIESHYYSAVGANLNIRLRSNDRWLLNMPVHVVSAIGVLFRCLLSGATLVIPEENDPLCEALEKYAITHVSLTPRQLSELLAAQCDRRRLPSLRHIIVRGLPAPEELQRAESRGFRVHPCYGRTEMASQVAVSSDCDGPLGRRTPGRVLPYRRLRVDENGNICVSGRTLYSACVVEGEQRAVPPRDGWYRTGDRGALDASGYLTIEHLEDPEGCW
ncbi:MAG TPA: hypothetical protein EYP62_06450 [Kiritimatiellae bacterium]|nr:hypothetical protein [Kiritimatiellia bacterium]